MVDKKDDILQLIKASVRKTDPGATVILYGSYARGDYNAESDIDVLILIDKNKVTWEDRERISYPLYDIQFEKNILISPMVRSKKMWETQYTISSFYKNVIKEGIVL